MKKSIIIAILILQLVLLPVQVFAASYYGCASAAINADNTFCDTPTGSCTGNNPQTAATVLAGTHTLFANGCTITIPKNVTITAAKLSNKDDGGAMVDGGQFTVATTGWDSPTTMLANLETGGTTGAALAVTGNGNLNPVLTLGAVGSPITITGGSANGMYGVSIGHTVGTVAVYANSTGGSNSTAYGCYWGNTGPGSYTGNATGATAPGFFNNAGANITLTGNATGSNSASTGEGVRSNSTGIVTIVGNIIAGTRSVGANGAIAWNPGASNYVTYPNGTAVFVGLPPAAGSVLTTANIISSTDGSVTAGTFDEAARNTDPGIANVKSGTTYKIQNSDLTGTMSATGGGSGAWSF